MVVDIENILVIDVTLKCTACRNKSNYCDCEEPNLVWDVFSLILAKQNNTPVYITVKDFDLLCSILDVTSSEIDTTMDYVRRFGEFKVFNETLKSKSFELKRVFSFFNKVTSKKAIYGSFSAKRDKVKGYDDNIIPVYARGETAKLDASNYLFANGTLKVGNSQEEGEEPTEKPAHFVLTYHVIAQHCEKVSPANIANLLFKNIFSQL